MLCSAFNAAWSVLLFFGSTPGDQPRFLFDTRCTGQQLTLYAWKQTWKHAVPYICSTGYGTFTVIVLSPCKILESTLETRRTDRSFDMGWSEDLACVFAASFSSFFFSFSAEKNIQIREGGGKEDDQSLNRYPKWWSSVEAKIDRSFKFSVDVYEASFLLSPSFCAPCCTIYLQSVRWILEQQDWCYCTPFLSPWLQVTIAEVTADSHSRMQTIN